MSQAEVIVAEKLANPINPLNPLSIEQLLEEPVPLHAALGQVVACIRDDPPAATDGLEAINQLAFQNARPAPPGLSEMALGERVEAVAISLCLSGIPIEDIVCQLCTFEMDDSLRGLIVGIVRHLNNINMRKEAVIAMLLHDVRSPASTIAIFLDQLTDDPGEAYQVVRDAVDRLLRTVDLAKVLLQEPRLEHVSVASVVSNYISTDLATALPYEMRSILTNCEFIWEGDDGCFVLDGGFLSAALMCALTNAVKYVDVSDPKIHIDWEFKESSLCLSVTNTSTTGFTQRSLEIARSDRVRSSEELRANSWKLGLPILFMLAKTRNCARVRLDNEGKIGDRGNLPRITVEIPARRIEPTDLPQDM